MPAGCSAAPTSCRRWSSAMTDDSCVWWRRTTRTLQRRERVFPMPLAGTASDLAIDERRVLHCRDVLTDPDTTPGDCAQHCRDAGHGRVFAGGVAPMLWEGRGVGIVARHRASLPAGFSRKRTRAAGDLCRPGGDRDRERAAVQRDARGAGAADRHRRGPAGDQQFGDRHAAGVRRHRRSSCERLCTRPALRLSFCTVDGECAPPSAIARRAAAVDGRDAACRPTRGSCRSPARASVDAQVMHCRRRAAPIDPPARLARRPRRRPTSRSLLAPCRGSAAASVGDDRACAQPGVGFGERDRAAADLRRPGGDRDRERAPVQRDEGSAGAADRHRRGAARHQQFGRPTSSRCSTPIVESCQRLFDGKVGNAADAGRRHGSSHLRSRCAHRA